MGYYEGCQVYGCTLECMECMGALWSVWSVWVHSGDGELGRWQASELVQSMKDAGLEQEAASLECIRDQAPPKE